MKKTQTTQWGRQTSTYQSNSPLRLVTLSSLATQKTLKSKLARPKRAPNNKRRVKSKEQDPRKTNHALQPPTITSKRNSSKSQTRNRRNNNINRQVKLKWLSPKLRLRQLLSSSSSGVLSLRSLRILHHHSLQNRFKNHQMLRNRSQLSALLQVLKKTMCCLSLKVKRRRK